MSESLRASRSAYEMDESLLQQWQLAVVAGLRAAVLRLDAALSEAESGEDEARRAYSALRIERESESNSLRAKVDAAKVESDTLRRELAAAMALVAERDREVEVLRRDRDALVQRAETAEQTLLNRGVSLRTMERDGGAHARERRAAASAEEAKRRALREGGLSQPPGRYQWEGEQGASPSPIVNVAPKRVPHTHEGGSPPP